jgi:hypothetical protein
MRTFRPFAQSRRPPSRGCSIGKGGRNAGLGLMTGKTRDTDGAVLRQRLSQGLCRQIGAIALPMAGPDDCLSVVGHTDSVGSFEAKFALSHARAGAVVRALEARHGVAVGGAVPAGLGPLTAVGSNGTDEGRGLNRRVKIVLRRASGSLARGSPTGGGHSRTRPVSNRPVIARQLSVSAS